LLNLTGNKIDQLPSISQANQLVALSLRNQNGYLKRIGNFTFERTELSSMMVIDLRQNKIDEFEHKVGYLIILVSSKINFFKIYKFILLTFYRKFY
jgi:hypothetical protein